MNTGHNLRKRGESYIGFVNRIWIANQGSFKVVKFKEQDLVMDLIDRGYSEAKAAFECQRGSDRLLLKAANHYERKLGLNETKLTAEVYKDNLICNCPQCARIGYHSNYFNASWLNICPVHKRPLTTGCPTCKRLWAGASQIQARNCEDCGPRMDFKTLAQRSAFDTGIYQDRFKILDDFFGHPLSSLQKNIVHTDLLRKTRFVNTDHFPSKAYPSFVARELGFDKSQFNELQELNIEIFPMEKVEFSYEKECDLFGPVDTLDLFSEAALKVRKEVLRVSSRELRNSKELDHPLGHCEHQLYRDPAVCPVCNTHRIISLSLSKSKLKGSRELFYYQSIREYDHLAPEPGILTGIKENRKLLPFPKEISMILYQLELWTQIKIMYYKLDRCAQAEIPNGMTLIDWGNLNPDIARESGSYSFPYFVTRNDNTGKLYIPKTFFDTSIEADAEFRQLIFPRIVG